MYEYIIPQINFAYSRQLYLLTCADSSTNIKTILGSHIDCLPRVCSTALSASLHYTVLFYYYSLHCTALH